MPYRFHDPVRVIPLLSILLITSALLVSGQAPEASRFTRTVLDNHLNEPMEVAVAADGTVYYIERPGYINALNPATGQKKRLGKLPVRFAAEDGLMGLALDPGFARNRWVYLYFGDPVPEGAVSFNVLARFEMGYDSLRQATRKDLLRIPVLPEGVSHSAGSIAFDAQGNLYLSTGDNTNPFESGGYAPTDDRPGRQKFDALRSAGNPNDLRGKILRIQPRPDGTYSIPDGNLFAKGTPGTRPEIYVMGCRNPYRIAIDQPSGHLYWGEVGPDAGTDSLGRGPRGHDEFNRALRAGNFGWPLVIADNKPYHSFDFETKRSGAAVLPAAPQNLSRNNTGIAELPPAQPALIWYPYALSAEFPALGQGGRNAIGGPVYRPENHAAGKFRFPAHYAGRWFIADWMRNWLMTVALDSGGRVAAVEPFLPDEKFDKPIDLAFGPDGALYVLEYGTYWRAKNTDARLSRIEYAEGNRPPVARLAADRTLGAAPLKVRFSAKGSFDHDPRDSLRYQWRFTGKAVQASGRQAAFTFTRPGTYAVSLTVTDAAGKSAVARQIIRVGNEPPRVSIELKENRSFYFSDAPIAYQVRVTDREDGVSGKTIAPGRVRTTFQHLAAGVDFAGLDGTAPSKPPGQALMESSDCKACHAKDKASVGPSLAAISKRYGQEAVTSLADKVIRGGGGVWGGEHAMSAHPQLSRADAAEMVRYILSLKEEMLPLPPQGTVRPVNPDGTYLLAARYTDRGGLPAQALVYLRPPRLLPADALALQGVALRNEKLGSPTLEYNEAGAWAAFRDIDLTGIRSVSARLVSPELAGSLDIRLDSATGPLVASLPVADSSATVEQRPGARLRPVRGTHTLYLVFSQAKGTATIWRRLRLLELGFGQKLPTAP